MNCTLSAHAHSLSPSFPAWIPLFSQTSSTPSSPSSLWQLFACCLKPKFQSHPSCFFLSHPIPASTLKNTKCFSEDWKYVFQFFLSCYAGPFPMCLCYPSHLEMDLFSHLLYPDCSHDLFGKKQDVAEMILWDILGEDFIALHSLFWNSALKPLTSLHKRTGLALEDE